uniref:Ribosomal protein L5 n=1 Tax=Micractinium singularis TaxID=2607981 RepID=A0A6M3RUI5_9CHLO|nr:ribosomal protein L5 [Micractinium singularis]
MQLPRIEKIVLNTTSKNYVNDKKYILFTLAALELLSGQKPQLTYAKKSVANFKIRQHQILGCKVVLRKNLMYIFLEKLSRIILPRIRDSAKKNYMTQINQKLEFSNSLKKNFFGTYSIKSKKFIAYTFGLKNLMMFPELENHFELVENFRGMNLTFVLSACPNENFRNQTDNSIELLLILSGLQIPLY